ncbi:hypothetical protein C4K08_2864 [Pseudomonas chlororaphis subsp. aureofaciens]|nr:hypothetical protein C4K08_2864 [Pseudomonas chlororaphis subsp. aureofaciens]
MSCGESDGAVFKGVLLHVLRRTGVMTCVHIRCCGHGRWRFRPYGDSLFSNAKKVSKNACPSIRCLARARHALTPALLRGPAATGHPWPGAASAASLPRYPLRNACVRPLGKGRVDQGQDQDQKRKRKPSAFYAPLVAAQASACSRCRAQRGCDRARSGRQIRRLGVSGRSRRMVLRLLRSRSQPAAAATGITFKSRPTGRSSRVAFDFLAPSGGRVEVLRSGQLDKDAELAAPGRGWPAAVTGITAKSRPAGRPPRIAFDFLAPSGGRVEVLRSGQLGRDAELAAPGHGWPVAAAHGAGPERGNPSPSEDRTLGARALWLLWGFSKVTRRKGGTLSSRYRSNGYVHGQGQGPEALP